MVLYGHKTVRAGDRAAVWSRNGSFKLIDGPKRVTLVRQKIEMLKQYTADQTHYLQIRKSTGAIEIHPGPCSIFFTPVEDDTIQVLPATIIDASQAIIVSSNSTKPGAGLVQRIVRGPARFIPAAEEWVDQKIQETTADQNSYIEVRKRSGQVEVFPGPCSMFIDPLTDSSISVMPAHNIDASEALVVCRRHESSIGVTSAAAGDAEGDDDSGTQMRLVKGPARFFPSANEWVQEKLKEYTADGNSYMEVRKRAGPIEIRHGPCSAFVDPVEDESITVRPATMIDASEALVVYKHSAGKSHDVSTGVERRVVRGPARFIPSSDEWIHKFEWSGMPKDGSKTSYQPRALQFSKLKVIPMTAYHNVNEVRTNDDTLLTVKLMLFFELIDVEKMLDATPDPIGDFINAASSDVIAFCASISYETFLNETYKLNDLGTFAQLTARAAHIGYKMEKVVFRGFQAGAKLQAMHDDAIQERTRLRLLEETQAQEQRAADLRLAAEQHRSTKEAQLKVEQTKLAAEISLKQQEAKIAEQRLVDSAEQERAKAQHEAAMAKLREQGEAEIAIEKARNDEQLRVMADLKDRGVDLTKVLVAQHYQSDSTIRLETVGAAGNARPPAADGKGKGMIGALQLNL